VSLDAARVKTVIVDDDHVLTLANLDSTNPTRCHSALLFPASRMHLISMLVHHARPSACAGESECLQAPRGKR
jgi:hypothetical protein